MGDVQGLGQCLGTFWCWFNCCINILGFKRRSALVSSIEGIGRLCFAVLFFWVLVVCSVVCLSLYCLPGSLLVFFCTFVLLYLVWFGFVCLFVSAQLGSVG